MVEGQPVNRWSQLHKVYDPLRQTLTEHLQMWLLIMQQLIKMDRQQK
jgi:hypothetical protein